MARYQDRFQLDLDDIELIEQAIRRQIAARSVRSEQRQPSAVERTEVHKLNGVLGKIHNQKIFYAQVRADGVPAG